MRGLLIIGYGNPLRGDDAVGFIAAERLSDWLEWEGGRLARSKGGSLATDRPDGGYASPTLQFSYPPEGARPQGSAIEVIARHCLTPELAADLARHRRALFIDAALDDPPGRIRCRRLRPQAVGWARGAHPTQDGPVPSPPLIHALTPLELLVWCLWLYGTAPKSSLITIGAESFAYGERLSPSVERALARLLRRLRGLGGRLLYQR